MARFFNKKVGLLALPLILSNLTIPLLGLSNTAIAGHLNHSYYLAAIGLGTMIFNTLYGCLNFFKLSPTGLIAQAFGANRTEDIKKIYINSIYLCLIVSCLLIVLQTPIEHFIFSFIGGSHTIQFYTQIYFFIRIWAAPAVILNYILMGSLIGLQDTVSPLLMALITNLLAIVLAVVLVFKFNLSIAGIAWADVIAQYAGALVGIYLFHKRLHSPMTRKHLKFDWDRIKHLFAVNTNIFIRTLFLTLGYAFFTIQSTYLGVYILAANTILLNFQMLLSYGLDGFANAAETLVGHAIGRGKRDLFIQAVIDTGKWSLLIAIGYSLVYLCSSTYIIDLLTSLTVIRTQTYQYIIFIILSPLLTVWCFWMDGVYIGGTQFKTMRNSMLISFIGYLLVWYLLKPFNNDGLWMSFLAFFVFRAITLGIRFKKSFHPILTNTGS